MVEELNSLMRLMMKSGVERMVQMLRMMNPRQFRNIRFVLGACHASGSNRIGQLRQFATITPNTFNDQQAPYFQNGDLQGLARSEET